ncbi:hypothetical protein [Bacillus sp. MRMR6]|uniref:hypothetical protein n=1 Tax=Bacillus sp. MRMR6 TaxID=1928617 RepID=UPI0009529941|nr:hypothetical protein [Bacillus sp. MRMR6]OLS38594.1 hypothetical protein BTR25_14345 [Bacillus sp. MRMR6]
MRRILFVLCVFIGSFFAYDALENEIRNIEQKHSELFAADIKPYKVIEDYDFVPNGRSGEIEDNSTVFYTKQDQQILDERKRLLGPLPFLSGVCLFLAIGGALSFLVLTYLKVSDSWEERQLKVRRLKREAYEKEHQEKLSQINQNFIEKVENAIKKHETAGTAMSFQEVQALRTELDNTINSYNTKVQVEYLFKQHMRIHNPTGSETL